MAVTATLIGGAALWYLKRTTDRDDLQLRHFKASEFGAYWPLMNIELLQKLDAFRDALGYPVQISPVPGAIGRPIIGADDKAAESGAERSYHNYLIHGEVMALDVLPKPPGGATPAERQRWRDVAKRVGFRGFGVYPDWKPRAGAHLDVRPQSALRSGQVMAEWAGIKVVDPATGKSKQELMGVEVGLV